MSDWVEQIKDHYDIVDLASEYMTLQKQGQNYMALCPFHGEKTPSFSVNRKKKIFHCFGCGIGGSVIDLYAKFNDLEVSESIRQLGQKMGLDRKKPLTQQQYKELKAKQLSKEELKQRELDLKQTFNDLCDLRNQYRRITENLIDPEHDFEILLQDEQLVSFYQHKAPVYEQALDMMLEAVLGESQDQGTRALKIAKGVLTVWGRKH